MTARPDDDQAAAHWRRIAEERRIAHEALARRPLVRAAVALERRTAPAVARARAVGASVRERTARASLALQALPSAGRVADELHRLRAESAAAPVAAPTRTVATIELEAGATTVELAAALARADAAVVIVAPAGVERLAGAVERLAAAVDDGVAIAAPTIVHGQRPRRSATPVDGTVLAAGLHLELDGDVPVAVATQAGRPAALGGPVVPVDAVLAAGVALDRARVEQLGGLAPVGDLDAALVELASRARGAGLGVVHVPAAVVVDERPLTGPTAVGRPIDPASAAWARVIDRRGAALRRAASSAERLEVAITIAAPSAKVAERWGDWHLAAATAGELERRGVGATVRTIDQVDDLAVRGADVHLVVRGLRAVRRTPGQRHVLWIISHPLDVATEELDDADLVLVASATHAAVLRTRTDTPVEVLLQATDHHRFRPVAPVAAHRHDVTIVAKSRERMRPMVAAAIDAGLAPAIYGGGWERLVDPALVVAEHVDNDQLPTVYASAGVVLNDHWDDMRRLGFVSNRIFDVLACGAPVVSDHVPELAELLGDVVPTWSQPSELGAVVRAVLDDPAAARARAERGRALVLAHHTFERRAAELLDALARHGLDRPPS